MPISIACPSCSKPYNVPDKLAGKQVRCQQCSHVFTVAALQPAALQPAGLDPLLSADLPPLGAPLPSAAMLPAAGLGTPLSPEGRPLGYAPLAAASPYAPSSLGGPVAPPLEGPTDAQFRLGSLAAIGIGLVFSALCVGTFMFDGSVFLWPLFVAPLLILFGIAGAIDPKICRAISKYGKNSPLHYKLIGWSLLGVSAVIVLILVVAMVQMGFRPGR